MNQPSDRAIFGRNGNGLQGFTLIDLMIAVAIVGILAAIAYPSYTNYMVKSRRSSAQTYLMDVAQAEQQYLLDSRGYATSLTALNMTAPSSVAPYYTIAITASDGPPPTFTVTATPIPGAPQASDVTLSIDNTGMKLPANTW